MEAPSRAQPAEICVNGEPRPWRSGLTVADLLEELGASGPGVAVEVNQRVIPRAQHPDILLQAGDRLEVVRLVGGG